MNKTETTKLINKIKGYYNSQFFIDSDVIDAWYETMKPYDLEDAIEHIQYYLKDNPDTPPKPHTFKKNLYTHEEKMRIKNSKYTVRCQMCDKWMALEDYDNHYDKCLEIDTLIKLYKKEGKDITREQLEPYSIRQLDSGLKRFIPNLYGDNYGTTTS